MTTAPATPAAAECALCHSRETVHYDTQFIWDEIKDVNKDVEIIGPADSQEIHDLYIELLGETDLEETVIREAILEYIYLCRDTYHFAEDAKKFYFMVKECCDRARARARAEGRLIEDDPQLSDASSLAPGDEDSKTLETQPSFDDAKNSAEVL